MPLYSRESKPHGAASDLALRYRDRVRQFEDEIDPLGRGLIATRVYRDQPGLPLVVKRAEIIAQCFEKIEPVILDEERIVGFGYRRFRVHEGVSDADAWRNQVMHPERRGWREDWPIPAAAREELRWWREQAPRPAAVNPARARHGWLGKYGIAHPYGGTNGHTLPDHGILLDAGIAELRHRIAARMATASAADERDELRAMGRCLEGLARHCEICARSAREKATATDEPVLRSRLETTAANCEAIATARPATFAQALQLLYFSHCADQLDTVGDATSFGRVDQILAPFYDADLAAGRLTPDDAFDLICHFLIKAWGAQTSANMTVGGVTPDGRDATNDLSYLFIEALGATAAVCDMSVRLHAGTPEAFRRATAAVVRLGLGRPSLYNDDITIEAIARTGIAIEDARDYAPLGCVEVMIPGRTAGRTMCMGLNAPKVLELVVNAGRCLVTGDTVWTDVPDSFDSFEALRAEYRRRVRSIIAAGVEIIREDERLEPLQFPRPWLTLLSRGGIEQARDLTAGQPKYDPVGVTLDGVADIANSLYALRRLVFEEQSVSLSELRGILQQDWEGREDLRQAVIHRFPRYGQDDAAINALAREEAEFFADCFAPHKTAYGGPFWPMIFGVATSMIAGSQPKTGATPSGRRRGESLSMSLQPSPAGPQGCVTALMRSIASIDFRRFPGGVSNVQELDPSLFDGEAGLDRLGGLIRAFFNMGGMELSLNFLSEERLREAQADPERFRYMMVRLFGLSAQFVNLSPAVQHSVFERVRAAAQRR